MLDDLLDDLDEDSGGHDDVVIGIDLGTTNSVVATVGGAEAKILVDDDGLNLHPSVISWIPSGKRIAGMKARLRRVIDPENTIFSAKRIIGKIFSEESTQSVIAQMPYRVEEGAQQECVCVTRAGKIRVTEISSYILAHLKEIAERRLGRPVRNAVITVPAHFSDSQRTATRQAAELAGLEVLRILNEPTAAALAYSRHRQMSQRIAVFDFGGGTFDVTLLAIRPNLAEVLATGGDPFLGGDDFDQVILNHLAAQFLKEHRLDPMTDPSAKARLQVAAEHLKMQLSAEESVQAKISDVAHGVGGVALGMDVKLTRKNFESMIEPLVQRSIEVTEKVLAEAGLVPSVIDEVILVGGSTRIPLVHQRVADFFGKEPRVDINPMEVVAVGAAMQGQRLLNPDEDQDVLMDVAPHSLRIATVGGYSQVIVKKNEPVPAEGVATFSVARDGQRSVEVLVAQGEEDKMTSNTPLGTLQLTDLPEAKRGELKVKVAFTVDADGILRVSAREVSTGVAAQASLSIVGASEER